MDNTPGKDGFEAWRRFDQRFGPMSVYTNFNFMSNFLKPPKRSIIMDMRPTELDSHLVVNSDTCRV